jgi:hypothetical protein
MALMISAGASFHWVESVTAETNTKGALKILVHGAKDASEEQFNQAEILIFIEDHDLVERLVAAINGATT